MKDAQISQGGRGGLRNMLDYWQEGTGLGLGIVDRIVNSHHQLNFRISLVIINWKFVDLRAKGLVGHRFDGSQVLKWSWSMRKSARRLVLPFQEPGY